MAYTAERVNVGGTEIIIASGTRGRGTPGNTQTINVCDSLNLEGRYRQVYRIKDRVDFVTPGDIRRCADLDELDRLMTQRSATREGPRTPGGR